MIVTRVIILLSIIFNTEIIVSQRINRLDRTEYENRRPADIIDTQFFNMVDSVIDLTPYRYHKYVRLDFLSEESVDQYADSLRNKNIDFDKPMYIAFWTYKSPSAIYGEGYLVAKTRKRTYLVPQIAHGSLVTGRRYLQKYPYNFRDQFLDLANTSRVRIIFKDGNKMKLIRMQNLNFMFLYE